MTHHALPAPAAPSAGLPAGIGVRAISTLVLMASLFVFAGALPPFATGIWFQTEPVTAALLGLGAAAALCLIALDMTGHPVGLLLGRVHVQVLLAFLAWNAIASLAQDFPARSWFGTPETGEGIFSFVAMAMLMMLAMALWPYRAARLAIAGAAIVSALTMGALQGVLPLDSPWRPAKYAGYAGVVGPALMVIVAGAARRFGWRALLLGWAVGLAAILFSSNRTAIALFCVAGPALVLPLSWLAARLRIGRRRMVLAGMPVLALALTCALALGAVIYGKYDPLYSVWSRGLLIRAAWQGLVAHGSALAIGFGWGSYNDILYQHTFIPGVAGFQNAVWNPNWEAVGPGAFHVHNDILEAVLGGGIISAALWLGFFATVIAGSRRRMLPAGAAVWFMIVGSLCFWFPFMLGMPFLAIAAAAGTAPLDLLKTPYDYRLGWWRRGAALVAALGLGLGAAATWEDARNGAIRLEALNRQDPGEIATLGAFPGDHGRGGVHLWWLALSNAASLGDRMIAGHPPTPDQALWYRRLLEEVDLWTARGQAGTRLEALTLALRNDLATAYQGSNLTPLRDREMPRWPEAVRRLTAHYPDRGDLAVPYLSWLAAHKDYETLSAWCSACLTGAPDDRVCLWYSGFVLLSDPATVAAGLVRMHVALQRGVAAVAPVPDAARDMIEANVAAGGGR